MEGNREVKSDVFSMLLEDPAYALQTHNALNHSDYQDPGLVEICTMERGISLTVRNDASFFLAMNLNIYEHQSTVCPNMPLRELIYVTNLLERYVKDKHIYGRKLAKLPTPRFAVFYNGTEEQPELELQQTIEKAIDRCIEEDVLKDFLKERRAEVLKVTQLDFTFDRWLELEREEARAEERVNTERERQAREQEKQRADQAEEQVRILLAQLEQYKKKD